MAKKPLQLAFSGRLLREFRERAGLTQQDLAKRCGLSRFQISRWETGQAKPEPAALDPLVRGLDEALQQSYSSKRKILLDDLLEPETQTPGHTQSRAVQTGPTNPGTRQDNSDTRRLPSATVEPPNHTQ